MKRMLMELEGEHPGVKQSMLKALSNVAPRHLLDTRLNPPAALRATARSLEGLGTALSPVEGRLPTDPADETIDEPPTITGPGRLLPVLR
jgi:hypothetical protein